MKRVFILAIIWGVIWALFLQLTKFGQFLAVKRTWLAVVVGVGIDLLLALPVVPGREWFKIFSIIAFSSLGIILRSLYNELQETLRDIENAIKTHAG